MKVWPEEVWVAPMETRIWPKDDGVALLVNMVAFQ